MYNVYNTLIYIHTLYTIIFLHCHIDKVCKDLRSYKWYHASLCQKSTGRLESLQAEIRSAFGLAQPAPDILLVTFQSSGSELGEFDLAGFHGHHFVGQMLHGSRP